MRCLSCDCNLSQREDSRRSILTGERIQLCDPCYEEISGEVPTLSRNDLPNEIDVEELT